MGFSASLLGSEENCSRDNMSVDPHPHPREGAPRKKRSKTVMYSTVIQRPLHSFGVASLKGPGEDFYPCPTLEATGEGHSDS